MNYRHIYHAGNFADVIKHVLLIGLVSAFFKKDKAFTYVDTHAGTGLYDLQSEAAEKTAEAQSGALKLLQATDASCEWVRQYREIIQQTNFSGPVQYYPGSPTIVRALLRPQDRMILSELHAADYDELKDNFFRDRSVAIHQLDAYTILKACLPPESRRGLILIDPPFEDPQEFKQMIAGLEQAFQRFATGVYALWYPIKNIPNVEWFSRALMKFNQPMFHVQVQLQNPSEKLSACGMVVINPPWQFAETCQSSVLPYLAKVLALEYRVS